MSILERKLRNFTSSFNQLIANEEYHTVLGIALMLPDICSKLEKPEVRNTGIRYAEWFDKYMGEKYKGNVGPDSETHTFLTGNDFYSLRCSFLHQGEANIEEQKARRVLRDFQFVKPQPLSSIHLNQIGDTLQLQVDIFCIDILFAVENWIYDHKENVQINERASKLMEINTEINFY